MKMLPILTVDKDEKTLRQISRNLTLEELKSKEIQGLINNMIYTAENTVLGNGWETAGLAAIQVGQLVAIIVSKDLLKNIFNVYINPEIKYLGNSKDIHLEGCLSIPNVEGNVERYKRVRVKYQDREGNTHNEEFKGFNARIIQHEYDHLIGELFTDKLV